MLEEPLRSLFQRNRAIDRTVIHTIARELTCDHEALVVGIQKIDVRTKLIRQPNRRRGEFVQIRIHVWNGIEKTLDDLHIRKGGKNRLIQDVPIMEWSQSCLNGSEIGNRQSAKIATKTFGEHDLLRNIIDISIIASPRFDGVEAHSISG